MRQRKLTKGEGHVIEGIQMRHPREVLKTIGAAAALVIGGLVAFFCYFVFVVGPLWPVGRLYLLYGPNRQALAAEGIADPQGQKMLSWAALIGLLVMSYGAYQIYRHDHAAEFLPIATLGAIVYGFTTYTVFEFKFMAWVGRLETKIQAIPGAVWGGYLTIMAFGALLVDLVQGEHTEERDR